MQPLLHYFPGGNTPEGFFSYYSEILSPAGPGKLAVIKGGPGTGKSTFLKALKKILTRQGESVTSLHCSSDPGSLDGIFLPGRNAAVIDGTAPHMTDAKYLGAYDTVLNFCDFIGEIPNKEALLSESRQASVAFMEGYCYLKSAKALLELMHSRSKQALLEHEVRSFAMDIVRRVSAFPANGTRKHGFLSAITADGFCNFLAENLKDFYVIALDTEVGDASCCLMETVADACRLRNADMMICPCPMNPHKAEHLLFPSANLALVSSNSFHPYPGADEIVPFSDFIICRDSSSVPRKLYDGALRLATEVFGKAREHHNRLEALYQPVTDYAAIEPLQKKALDFLIS